MKEPIWLNKSVIIAIHEILLVEHGGPVGMRDEGLLESAISRPINQYFYEKISDIFDLAAMYATGIIKNHPFVDGNKRTAFVSMKIFLARNGFWLKFPKDEAVATFFSLAADEIKYKELSKIIKKYSIKLKS